MTKHELVQHLLGTHDPGTYITSGDTKKSLAEWHNHLHTKGADHDHGESEGEMRKQVAGQTGGGLRQVQTHRYRTGR